MAYSKLYYPPTSNGLQKTLGAALDSGTTSSMTLNNVTSIQDKPGVVVINRIDANSTELSSSLREYVSYTNVSGSTLTGLARGLAGTSDLDHAVGSVVEFIPDITWAQALIDAFLVEHVEATAVHSSALVTTLKATAAVVTTGTSDLTIATPLSLGGLDTKTSTYTNKRITKRVTTIASEATPTINTDNCDAVTITAQATAITSMTTNLSGTPTNFQTLIIRIKDNGTARAITWGSSFEAKGVALPTTTVLSKVLTVGLIYDTVTSKWGCVASVNET